MTGQKKELSSRTRQEPRGPTVGPQGEATERQNHGTQNHGRAEFPGHGGALFRVVADDFVSHDSVSQVADLYSLTSPLRALPNGRPLNEETVNVGKNFRFFRQNEPEV